MIRRLRWAGLSLLVACGPPPSAVHREPGRPPAGVQLFEQTGRPPVAVLVRQGDPASAMAVVVTTTQIAPEYGSVVAVALAGLVEARVADAEVRADANGFRVRLLAKDDASVARETDALRHALAEPVKSMGPEWETIRKKLAALRTLPAPPPALTAASACQSLLAPNAREPAAEVVESWRSQAIGVGRVVFATVGSEAAGRAAVTTLAKGPSWPIAAPIRRAGPAIDVSVSAPLAIYDASGELPAGNARAVVVAQIDPQRVGSMARTLGDPNGALTTRLRGLERGASVAAVSATRHVGSGCVTVDLRILGDARSGAGAIAIARAIVLARREMLLAGRSAPHDAEIAPDVRDAAEQVAFATLALGAPTGADVQIGPVAVGIAATANPRAEVDLVSLRDSIDKEAAALEAAWNQPVVVGKVRVENAQPQSYVLLASPCGTAPESDDDAGVSALVAVAAARHAHVTYGVDVDPWIAGDAVGLIGHAPALAGEPALTTITRIADAVARSFVVDAPDDIGIAQSALASDTKPVLSLLAEALAPSHVSWVVPTGTQASLLRASSAHVGARADAMRRGPLRAVVLANVDEAQARTGLLALDRWVARATEPRSCPASATPQPPKPGTYAIETDGASEAYVAAPLDGETAKLAPLVAAALEGPNGLLVHALGSGLVRSASARVLGAPRAPALVIHVEAPSGALDAAVAQVRALLDRLQHGALADADLARARQALSDQATSDALDPKERIVTAFRAEARSEGPPPSIDALRAACATLKDSALIIVAARPHGRRP